MKANSTWQFSSRAADIDIGRILTEAGKVKDVVRITVDGKPFTIAPRMLAARHGVESEALGILTTRAKFDNEHGTLRLTGLDPVFGGTLFRPNYNQECLVFDKDIACKLVRCVVTKVETF